MCVQLLSKIMILETRKILNKDSCKLYSNKNVYNKTTILHLIEYELIKYTENYPFISEKN